MEINGNSLLASLLISSMGFVAFMYGKRQRRLPQMLVGVLLMGFPYFVSNVLLMFGLAVVLLACLWGMLRLGL
jgi:hypothetical protein